MVQAKIFRYSEFLQKELSSLSSLLTGSRGERGGSSGKGWILDRDFGPEGSPKSRGVVPGRGRGTVDPRTTFCS